MLQPLSTNPDVVFKVMELNYIHPMHVYGVKREYLGAVKERGV